VVANAGPEPTDHQSGHHVDYGVVHSAIDAETCLAHSEIQTDEQGTPSVPASGSVPSRTVTSTSSKYKSCSPRAPGTTSATTSRPQRHWAPTDPIAPIQTDGNARDSRPDLLRGAGLRAARPVNPEGRPSWLMASPFYPSAMSHALGGQAFGPDRRPVLTTPRGAGLGHRTRSRGHIPGVGECASTRSTAGKGGREAGVGTGRRRSLATRGFTVRLQTPGSLQLAMVSGLWWSEPRSIC
jgi:hypothetical protein